MSLSDPFFVRNALYGLEDSLISTSGVVVGMTFANVPPRHIANTGLLLIIIEALSMAYGSFLSEAGFLSVFDGRRPASEILPYSLTMFASYCGMGLVVLFPYLARLPNPHYWTMAISISLLFCLVIFVEGTLWKALALTAIGAVILAISIAVGRRLDQHKLETSRSP